ncbi:conserved hypothetical protein [Candidatus Desulfosporosinus infrequens]|uniref:Uncharacterized protein n=1 Tax=Candidatus Desulfosporosinus infrequens TaxID=2043169 RepID=A0A2U3LB67_9FIRM|nr:conserved hypothetical protein [Candidatus Desulfosporosinus infrequens]
MDKPVHFNPRSRVGSDLNNYVDEIVATDFNPRSRVGSDSFISPNGMMLSNFNPRSRVGSDVRTTVTH